MQFSVSTEFFQWCCKRFAEPVMRMSEDKDPESLSHLDREFKFRRNHLIRDEARDEQIKAGKYSYMLLVNLGKSSYML